MKKLFCGPHITVEILDVPKHRNSKVLGILKS